MTTNDLDAIRPATDLLLMRLRETVGEIRSHDHPAKGADLYCLNLTSFLGERMSTVLRRLAEEQAETRKWQERNTALADEFTAEADRLNAQVAELTAELARVREQLTAANHRADGLDADLRSAVKGNTKYANEVAAKDAVIEAAKALAEFPATLTADFGVHGAALIAAVDALPTVEAVAR